MADSGPPRRHGWIPRVRGIPGNGFDSLRDIVGTDFRPCLGPGGGPGGVLPRGYESKVEGIV